ncbi:MAG: hypothetical protein SV375_02775 [Thermodesulfobacteriota bacterium]|nr:hypothetical protein [Thermodesulfobacteriota bacterium]
MGPVPTHVKRRLHHGFPCKHDEFCEFDSVIVTSKADGHMRGIGNQEEKTMENLARFILCAFPSPMCLIERRGFSQERMTYTP